MPIIQQTPIHEVDGDWQPRGVILDHVITDDGLKYDFFNNCHRVTESGKAWVYEASVDIMDYGTNISKSKIGVFEDKNYLYSNMILDLDTPDPYNLDTAAADIGKHIDHLDPVTYYNLDVESIINGIDSGDRICFAVLLNMYYYGFIVDHVDSGGTVHYRLPYSDRITPRTRLWANAIIDSINNGTRQGNPPGTYGKIMDWPGYPQGEGMYGAEYSMDQPGLVFECFKERAGATEYIIRSFNEFDNYYEYRVSRERLSSILKGNHWGLQIFADMGGLTHIADALRGLSTYFREETAEYERYIWKLSETEEDESILISDREAVEMECNRNKTWTDPRSLISIRTNELYDESLTASSDGQPADTPLNYPVFIMVTGHADRPTGTHNGYPLATELEEQDIVLTGDTDLEITKIWDDASCRAFRPEQIDLDLYIRYNNQNYFYKNIPMTEQDRMDDRTWKKIMHVPDIIRNNSDILETGKYTPLEYIESSGGRYVTIESPGNFSSDTHIDLDFMPTSWGAGSQPTFMSYYVIQAFCTSDNRRFSVWSSGGSKYSSILGVLNQRYQVKYGVTASNTLYFQINNGTTLSSSGIKNTNRGISIGAYYNGNYPMNMRIYGCTITVDDNIYRDLIPVRKNSDNTLGLYDKVTGTFYTGAVGSWIGDGSEVKKYTQLEYIQSSSDAYVNLNQMMTPDTGIMVDCQITSYQNTSKHYPIWCVYQGSQHYELFVKNQYISVVRWGDSSEVILSPSSNLLIGTDRHIIDAYQAVYKKDGIVIHTGVRNNVSTSIQPIILFGYISHAGNLDSGHPIGKLYGARLYGDRDVNLVPVRRNSDNVLGLLDTVSNTFYPGSGTWTAGPVYSHIEYILQENTIANKFPSNLSSGDPYIISYSHPVWDAGRPAYTDHYTINVTNSVSSNIIGDLPITIRKSWDDLDCHKCHMPIDGVVQYSNQSTDFHLDDYHDTTTVSIPIDHIHPDGIEISEVLNSDVINSVHSIAMPSDDYLDWTIYNIPTEPSGHPEDPSGKGDLFYFEVDPECYDYANNADIVGFAVEGGWGDGGELQDANLYYKVVYLDDTEYPESTTRSTEEYYDFLLTGWKRYRRISSREQNARRELKYAIGTDSIDGPIVDYDSEIRNQNKKVRIYIGSDRQHRNRLSEYGGFRVVTLVKNSLNQYAKGSEWNAVPGSDSVPIRCGGWLGSLYNLDEETIQNCGYEWTGSNWYISGIPIESEQSPDRLSKSEIDTSIHNSMVFDVPGAYHYGREFMDNNQMNPIDKLPYYEDFMGYTIAEEGTLPPGYENVDHILSGTSPGIVRLEDDSDYKSMTPNGDSNYVLKFTTKSYICALPEISSDIPLSELEMEIEVMRGPYEYGLQVGVWEANNTFTLVADIPSSELLHTKYIAKKISFAAYTGTGHRIALQSDCNGRCDGIIYINKLAIGVPSESYLDNFQDPSIRYALMDESEETVCLYDELLEGSTHGDVFDRLFMNIRNLVDASQMCIYKPYLDMQYHRTFMNTGLGFNGVDPKIDSRDHGYLPYCNESTSSPIRPFAPFKDMYRNCRHLDNINNSTLLLGPNQDEILGMHMYDGMFRGSGEVNVDLDMPLSVGTPWGVCKGMFENCDITSDISSIISGASNIGNHAFRDMFRESAVSFPDMPSNSERLWNFSFANTYLGANIISDGDCELPRQQIDIGTYLGMFEMATGRLVKMLAKVFDRYSCNRMFYNSDIKNIEVDFLDWNYYKCHDFHRNWTGNITCGQPTATEFRFYKPSALPVLYGPDYIPAYPKWEVNDMDDQCLNFYMPNGGTIALNKTGSPTVVELEYSLDRGKTWTVWSKDESGNRSLTLTAGQRMYVRNTSKTPTPLYTNDLNQHRFSFNSDTYANGRLESLICKNVNYIGIVAHAFRQWFTSQPNLRKIPEIRSNIKGAYAYHITFSGSSIEEVYIDCPVPVPAMFCYAFNNSSKLKKVVTNMTDISAHECLYNWLNGVSPTGDFYCPAELTISTGSSGIPSGWTRHNIDGDKYLNFTMPEGGTLQLVKGGSPTEVTLEYLIEGAPNWVTWQPGANSNRVLTLPANGKVYIRNTSMTSTGFSKSTNDYYEFVSNKNLYANGNVNSLLCKNPEDAVLTPYCFQDLFYQNTRIITPPEFPSTTLASNCYRSAFNGCSSLTQAPELPATTLVEGCYRYMFFDCSSLTEISTQMTDISATDCLNAWVDHVSPTGDFYCPAELTISTGPSGIPTGWTRHDLPNEYLKKESELADEDVALCVEVYDGLRFIRIEDVPEVDLTNMTLKPYVRFHRGKNGRSVAIHASETSGMWAEFNRYRLRCDTTAAGGFSWSVTINGTAKRGTVSWAAGATLDSIVTQLQTRAVATYLVFSHNTNEDFIRIRKGGYTYSIFTITNVTGATLEDLSLYTKVGDVQQSEVHRDWQTRDVVTLFPNSGYVPASTRQYSISGYNLSYRCGGNETKYKSYYTSNGSTTYLAETSVSSRMRPSAFNAMNGSGVAEQQALYDKYNGSWDAYMEASMANIDDTHTNGMEYMSYDNGDSQTSFIASVTTMDFDGSYIPAYPVGYRCWNYTDNDISGEHFHLATLHENLVYMRDAKMTRINAALAYLNPHVNLVYTGRHYWAGARYGSNGAWFYNYYNGTSYSNNLYCSFYARPLAYLN